MRNSSAEVEPGMRSIETMPAPQFRIPHSALRIKWRADVPRACAPGSVRGLRLCRLVAGDLRASLGPNPPIEHECGDRHDKRRRERGDPMEQKVHNGARGGRTEQSVAKEQEADHAQSRGCPEDEHPFDQVALHLRQPLLQLGVEAGEVELIQFT